MSENSYMLEIQPLIEKAKPHFIKEYTTFDDVESWLHDATNIPHIVELPDSIKLLISSGKAHKLTSRYTNKNTRIITGLDPATGGVLIAGLVALLNYIATERRHKDTLKGNKPPSDPGNNILTLDLCKYVSTEGQVYGLPVKETKIISFKGRNRYIVKVCEHEPEPHFVSINI